MSICDAHDSAWGSKKNLVEGEGFLLVAKFMQNSPIQEKLIDKTCALYTKMGMALSRKQCKTQIESTQGNGPWIICQDCVNFLNLSDADKEAAHEAAKKWWQDKSTSGHMPGQKTQKKNKPEMVEDKKATSSFIKELGQEKKLYPHSHVDVKSSDSSSKQAKKADVSKPQVSEQRYSNEQRSEKDWEPEEIAPQQRKQDGKVDELEKMPTKGHIIDGRYKILCRIDTGDLFNTYKAQDLQDDIIVAIKYIPASVANDIEAIDKLRSKADSVLALSHPNIASLYKAQLDGVQKYLVMEYVDGKNFEDRIFDHGTMSVAETVNLFSQIAEALDYAHSKNILHGDIKPANIMLTKDGKVKLIDVATGRLIKETLDQKNVSSNMSSYLIPEELRGDKYDYRSEIYSLAATMYECLSGHPPFWGSSIENQILNENPKPLEELSDNQNKVLLQALSKHPEDRQKNAKELLNCLKEELAELKEKQEIIPEHKESITLKQEEPEDEDESKPTIKGEPKVKSKMLLVIPAVSIMLALIIGIAIFSWQHKKKNNNRADIFRKTFWQKAQLDPLGNARLLDRIHQSTEVDGAEIENYMRRFREKSDIFLKVPDRGWSDFAYRHGRIPVVGKEAKCVLTVDVKEEVIGTKEYGFISVTVKRKKFTATVTVKDHHEVICSKSFVDTDPPLPYSVKVRTFKGLPSGGYVGYHTANTEIVLNKARKYQIPSIRNPSDSLSKRSTMTEAERIFVEACYYLIIEKPSLGCKKLRYVIEEYPKSEFAREASQILNTFGEHVPPIRLPKEFSGYEDTNFHIDEVWEDMKQLAEEKKYELAMQKAKVFIEAFPHNIYTAEISEHILLWEGIILKPKIEELLSKAKSSKNGEDFDKALEYILAVFKLDPNCSEAKIIQTEIKSLKKAQRIATEKETRFRSLKEKALSFEADKNWESAIKAHSEVLLIKPSDQESQGKLSFCQHSLYLSKAKVAESKGDINATIEFYTKALSYKHVASTQIQLNSAKHRLQVDLEKARRKKELAKWINRAQESKEKGNLSDAISYYEKAQEYTDVSLKENIGTLKQRIAERKKTSKFNELFNYAKTTSDQTPDKALEALEKALSLYPNNTEALELKKYCKQVILNKSLENAKGTLQTLEKPKVQLAGREETPVLKKKISSRLSPPNMFYHRQTLKGHGGWVTSAAFSPTGDRIVSGSFDTTVRIWDTGSGDCLKILRGHNQLVQAVAYSPDGKHIASGDGWYHILKIWDASTGRCLHTIKAHVRDIHDLSFSPDGKFIASVSDDKLIKIWNVKNGACIRTLKGHKNGVFCVEFSPDGKYIASGSWDKTVKLWNVNSGTCIQTFKGHQGTIEDLSFSPDGSRIASCGHWDRKIIIWDISKGNEICSTKPETHGFYSVAFSPDGNYIAAGNANGEIQLRNAKTGEYFKTVKAHGGFPSVIFSMEFSSDGNHLLSAGTDNLVKVWAFQ